MNLIERREADVRSGQLVERMDVATIALDRDETIAAIKGALKLRSGKAWSVKGGRGTAWGWIAITAPPARRDEFGCLSETDAAMLSSLLDMTVHHQGVSVPASSAYRREYLQRARGEQVTEIAHPYWD